MDNAHMLSKAEAQKYKFIKMSHAEYITKLHALDSPVMPIETFRGAKVAIMHICTNGHISKMLPCNILQKHYCKQCSYSKTNSNILHYKNDLMYEEELVKKRISVKPLESYQDAFTKIMHECLICGFQYKAAPHNILRGKERCSACKDQQVHNNYVERVHKVNPTIEILSYYSRNKGVQKLNVRCKKCGHEWEVFSNTLYSHRECQQCGKVTNAVDKNAFIFKLKERNSHIILIDEYRRATDQYQFLCQKCNHIFTAKGSEMSSGRHSCPYCATVSNGELLIVNILDKYNIPYIPQKTFLNCKSPKGYVMPFDFYLPSYNTLMEYQGIQHEKPIDYFGGEKQFESQKLNDSIKKKYAVEHGYKYVEIWYKDFSHIEEILIKELKLGTAETAG